MLSLAQWGKQGRWHGSYSSDNKLSFRAVRWLAQGHAAHSIQARGQIHFSLTPCPLSTQQPLADSIWSLSLTSPNRANCIFIPDIFNCLSVGGKNTGEGGHSTWKRLHRRPGNMWEAEGGGWNDILPPTQWGGGTHQDKWSVKRERDFPSSAL